MEPTALEDCDNTCKGSELEPESIALILPDRGITDKMAEMFKALGDPTRVRLIYALSQQELCVHDLSVILDMGQSAISHQLRYLRNLRIVKRRKEGKTVFYSLNDAHVEQIFLQTHEHVRHEYLVAKKEGLQQPLNGFWESLFLLCRRVPTIHYGLRTQLTLFAQ